MQVGDVLVTNKRRPILTLVEDTSPGVHDTCMSACDIYRYRGLGVEGHHDSCTDNLFKGSLRATGALAMQSNDASLLRQSSSHLCCMQCLPISKHISDMMTARAHFSCCCVTLFAHSFYRQAENCCPLHRPECNTSKCSFLPS